MKTQDMKLGLDFGNVIKYIGGGQVDGVFDAVETLTRRVFRDRIFVISRVDSMEGAEKAKLFLAQINFNLLIPPGHVHFCFRREEKAPIAEMLGLTHFVDDRTECLSHMKSVKYRYAMNPTPKQVVDFPPDGMTVVKSWQELTPIILATAESIS